MRLFYRKSIIFFKNSNLLCLQLSCGYEIGFSFETYIGITNILNLSEIGYPISL